VPRDKKLDKKLAAYAIAGAALALPSAAHATIITTPVNQTVNGSSTGASYDFNLSDVGSDDITVTASLSTNNDEISASVNGNAFVVMVLGDVVALNAGDTIGSSSNFGTGGKMVQDAKVLGVAGPWPSDNSTAYLGFSFQDLSSNTHYGWAQIQTQVDEASDSFTVVNYAYQSDPNTSILAGDTGAVPEPSSVALVGLGAIGLVVLRRRRAARS